MATETTTGIEMTYPYEATSPGVARHQCSECGAWERADQNGGRIRHGRRCESRPQASQPAAAAAAPPRPAAAALVATYTKQGNVWCLRIAGAVAPGTEIAVTKRDGSTKTEIVGEPIGDGVYQIATDLRAFGQQVRRTGMTGGRDQDVLEAVRAGYLSQSAAMNTDD